MKKESAGLLLFRERESVLEVLLVHPGGPFWKNKDLGAWTIPKGEIEPGADPLATALREFEEETGFQPHGPYLPLGSVKLKSGKTVQAWAFRGDCDPSRARSNSVTLEWPPGSGRTMTFPEVDRAEFFPLGEASRRLNPAQTAFLTALEKLLSAQ